MDVRVECYEGHRGGETPRRLAIAGRTIEVLEVIERWREPDQRYFKLRGDDDTIYLLRHDELEDRWEIVTP